MLQLLFPDDFLLGSPGRHTGDGTLIIREDELGQHRPVHKDKPFGLSTIQSEVNFADLEYPISCSLGVKSVCSDVISDSRFLSFEI